MSLDYITSGRFIHDSLVREAKAGQRAVVNWWREHGEVPPSVIFWPKGPVLCDDGEVVEGTFSLDLPRDPSGWKDIIRRTAERTRACGLMLTCQHGEEVRSIYEDEHGTMSWHYAIVAHGPDRVLGDPVVLENAHYVGLLWKPSSPADPPEAP